MITILDKIPSDFYTSKPKNLWKIFDTPTLIKIPGKNKETIFISTLLHGNETSGFYAIQKLLKQERFDKSLLVFFGNIEAAKFECRHLDNQTDYNRILVT